MKLSLVVLVAACWRSTPVAPKPAAPACQAGADTTTPGKVSLVVNGVNLGVVYEDEAHWVGAKAVVFPHGPSSILVGMTVPGHYGSPQGVSTLWDIDCGHPTLHAFVDRANADFGHAAMSADGATLYFTGEPRIQALDLATLRVRDVTSPPTTPQCGDQVPHDDLSGYQLVDNVVAFHELDDVLEFRRGGACGNEGDWDAQTLYLDHPAKPNSPPRAPQPVVAIARDAGGTLWASDGSCSSARISQSRDGVHWTALPIPHAESAPSVILPDEKRPGILAVLSASCTTYGPMYGGWIYVTHDAGKTWVELPFPRDMQTGLMGSAGDPGQPRMHLELFDQIALHGGSVDALRLWAHGGGEEPTDPHPDAAWQWHAVAADSDDDPWKLVEDAPPRPHDPPARVDIAGGTLEISPDGVLKQPGRTRTYLPRQ